MKNETLSLVLLTEVKFNSIEWWSLLLPLGGAAFLPLLLFGRAALLLLLWVERPLPLQ